MKRIAIKQQLVAALETMTLTGICKDIKLMTAKGILARMIEKSAAIAIYQKVKVALQVEHQRYQKGVCQ